MSRLLYPSPDLATVVRSRRQLELGLTREDLAERLGWKREGGTTRSGFSPRTIVRLEKGERGLRNERELMALCFALEIDRPGLLRRIASAREAREQGQLAEKHPQGMVETLLSRIRADIAALEALLDPPPDFDPIRQPLETAEPDASSPASSEAAPGGESPGFRAIMVVPDPSPEQARWLTAGAGDVFLPLARPTVAPARRPQTGATWTSRGVATG